VLYDNECQLNIHSLVTPNCDFLQLISKLHSLPATSAHRHFHQVQSRYDFHLVRLLYLKFVWPATLTSQLKKCWVI